MPEKNDVGSKIRQLREDRGVSVAELAEQSGSTVGLIERLEFFSLASDKSDRHMEPFLIDVHPPTSEDCKLSSHEGEEFIYVLAGQIDVVYGKERYTFQAGDSIYYDSIVPHNGHAGAHLDARTLAVVYAPC